MSAPITNPKGFGGYTDLPTKIVPEVRTFLAGGAITDKNVVWLTTTGTVVVSATDSAAVRCVGIATKTVASGELVPVVIWGPVEDVPSGGDVAAGDIVKRSVTTAGEVAATATPGIAESLGFAISDDSAQNGTTDIFVWPGRGGG